MSVNQQTKTTLSLHQTIVHEVHKYRSQGKNEKNKMK